jgi:niacin transporter
MERVVLLKMSKVKQTIYKLTISGLLIAIGIVIPMFSPFKVQIEPASFTLASHVAIFIAMFISPGVAVAVAAGTTLGFLFGGFFPVVVLRAASHLIFAVAGALYLRKAQKVAESARTLRMFSLSIALVHALCELIVVSIFYVYGSMGPAYYENGFFSSVLLLVGLGTVIHSMVDFEIANIVVSALKKVKNTETLFS